MLRLGLFVVVGVLVCDLWDSREFLVARLAFGVNLVFVVCRCSALRLWGLWCTLCWAFSFSFSAGAQHMCCVGCLVALIIL